MAFETKLKIPTDIWERLEEFVEKWGPPGEFRKSLFKLEMEQLLGDFGRIAIQQFIAAAEAYKKE